MDGISDEHGSLLVVVLRDELKRHAVCAIEDDGITQVAAYQHALLTPGEGQGREDGRLKVGLKELHGGCGKLVSGRITCMSTDRHAGG
jgi:hypothetical protein